MTVFVQREAGAIVGVFANRQPGVAEESLAPDDAELAAFRAAAAPAKSENLTAAETLALINAGRGKPLTDADLPSRVKP